MPPRFAPEHKSTFSYNITRQYPFKWITPVILVGGFVCAALFTFLNFASSGYTFTVEISTTPNATTADANNPFRRWPSVLTARVKPSCQSVDIPTNTKFFTNQSALTYDLGAVWLESIDGPVVIPALSYYNNVLEECTVTAVDMDLAALDRSAIQFAYSEWGIVARTFVTCRVNSTLGTLHFNATQSYDFVPNTVSFANIGEVLFTNFRTRNPTTKASLWWGQSLLSTYWAYTSRLMQDIRVNATANRQPGIRKGTISFERANVPNTDITSLDFFKIRFRFIVDKGLGDFEVISGDDGNNTISGLDREQTNPNIWIPADSLAKSVYSTVLTDLGQVTATPNILTNASVLQYFTSNFSLAFQHLANARPGPATDNYDALKSTTGPLTINPSVIAAGYTCQIPQLKTTGDLILSILIADLVLLQVVWILFKFGVDAYLTHRFPSSNICNGCMTDSSGGREEPIKSPSSRKKGNYHELFDFNDNDASSTKRWPIQRRVSSRQSFAATGIDA